MRCRKEWSELKKTYYQCSFTQTAPLRIATGFGEETDSDVMTDRLGLPFIPGTSIAGVLRSLLSAEAGRRLFGDIKPVITESKVLVSDATLSKDAEDENDYRISPRDGVSLEDGGTAKNGAKYDFQTVECSLPYTGILELSQDASLEDQELLEGLLWDITEHGVPFGARTTRGYGAMRAEIRRREFQFPDDLQAWLSFEPTDPAGFGGDPLQEPENTQYVSNAEQLIINMRLIPGMRIELEPGEAKDFRGSFSVRKNTTEPGNGSSQPSPDYSPLTNKDGCPVIPGTSWAGAFRHHMRDITRTAFVNSETDRDAILKATDKLFGVVPKKEHESPKTSQETETKGKQQKQDQRKSAVFFEETEMSGSSTYPITRIAVDRFTSSPRNQGLFTSRVAWGGEGELTIRLPAMAPNDLAAEYPTLLSLFAICINDLNLGLLTVGREGNIGRGIFMVKSIQVNGVDKTEDMFRNDADYICVGGNHHGAE